MIGWFWFERILQWVWYLPQELLVARAGILHSMPLLEEKQPHAALQLRRAITFQAEGKKLLGRRAIAP